VSSITPQVLNGAYFFPERLATAGVVLILICAGSVLRGRWMPAAASMLIAYVGCTMLYRHMQLLDPIARRIEQLHASPGEPVHGRGVIAASGRCAGSLWFDPYRWASLMHFQKSRAVFLNNAVLHHDYMILDAREWIGAQEPYAMLALLENRGPAGLRVDFAVESGCGDGLERLGLVRVKDWGNEYGKLYMRR
jgi:hypothetical protein